jgi:hypothetical protein
MNKGKATTKAFYQHTESGQILIIERRADGQFWAVAR